MKFPYKVIENLSNELIDRWEKCYVELSQEKFKRNRKIDEGIWRRTQMFFTRKESGWKSREDMRRRMLHYIHTYDVINRDIKTFDLCMVQSYVWIHLSFPKNEIKDYLDDILKGLEVGHWNKESEENNAWLFSKNNLMYKILYKNTEEEDMNANRKFPSNYRFLEIKVYTNKYEDNFIQKQKSWGILNNGPRIKDRNGNYHIIENIEEIIPYLPAHIELGCGPSIELGIPPLNFLHDVYYVTDKSNNKFILGNEKDRFAYNIAAKTVEMYKLFSIMYKKCFIAKANSKFYKNLKILNNMGFILNPIFTNNFDGLPIQLGMDEYYLRRYEQENIIPKVAFDKNAKALISIGCHADRRKIQESARKAGLKIIHIDPEGYEEGEQFISYPLEAKKDGDYMYKETSSKAFEELIQCLERKQ